MTASTKLPSREFASIEYPESDGKPMADSDAARRLMVDCIETLSDYFASQEDVYVSGDILMYYEEGNPKRCVAPDVLVTLGIRPGDRDVYKTWVEGKPPDFVLEVASKTTWPKDFFYKSLICSRLGVREYLLFDRTGGWFPSDPIFGYRLEAGEYVPLETDERGRMATQVLGLELAVEDGWLRFYEPESGRRLPTTRERISEAEERASEAEERLRRLEAELRRIREQGGPPPSSDSG